ncbi:acyltransferase family protein [Massilia solisilvae]|uniref:Acyltransferase family protein n=1 Tax=Massilia solisilvae TaxID=1811225 RepID=A0ABT2BG28_9BURK|nr:acyltransferase family protein [Massilia solisilvae]MCS0607469.1 acyltransferase family protein [Massilia solisilvae]
MHTTDTTAPTRLFFLDWLRIIAFFILIVFHVGMYYVSWDWHVKSPAAGPGPEPFMLLSSPWRLDLLFLVSGVASSFMLAKGKVAGFLRQRSIRLLVPLLFGMLVVVPPQSYLEVVEKVAYDGSYLDFMRLYLTGYGGFCRGHDCLILPTWNHLWFVAYLWIYTLFLAALVAALGDRFDTLASRVARSLAGWRIIVLPALVLAIVRVLLAGRFPQNHAVIGDWYSHATYFSLFVLGALLARVPRFWPRLGDVRWVSLGVAAGCWVAAVIFWAVPDDAVPAGQVEALRVVIRTVYAFLAWCAIAAACGFAQRHLQRDGAARRYLTEAVFPVYIAHQTLIVVMAHALKPLRLAPGLEAMMLVVATLVASFGIFEAVRRSALLRPLFGLAAPRKQAAGASPRLAPARAA